MTFCRKCVQAPQKVTIYGACCWSGKYNIFVMAKILGSHKSWTVNKTYTSCVVVIIAI